MTTVTESPATPKGDTYFVIGGPLDGQTFPSPGDRVRYVWGEQTGDPARPVICTEVLYSRTKLTRGARTYYVLLSPDGYCRADLDRAEAAGCCEHRRD